jgi:hypothetical protein
MLLNKCDFWGRTTASREAMMNHYRTKVFPELVHRFRSRFGITIQLGYASLTQPAHTPYNHLIVKEFLTSLDKRPSAYITGNIGSCAAEAGLPSPRFSHQIALPPPQV